MTDQACQVAVQAADGYQAIVRSVPRNLRHLRHVFEAHLVSDAAVSGADQKQRRLFVIDRDQHAPSAEIAIPASGRGVLIFPRSFRSRQIDHRHRAVFLILRVLPAVW